MLAQLLSNELKIFEKLLLTHRNAHRRNPYFQRLLAVRKYLRTLNLSSTSSSSSSSLSSTSPSKERVKHDLTHLDRLSFLVKTCDHVRGHAVKASRLLMIQLGMSYHMPFALTMVATCGRFLTLTKQMRSTW